MLTQQQMVEYFQRIGLSIENLSTSLSDLRKIMLHHALAFPFENLDMHNVLNSPTHKPTPIELEQIFTKMVRQKRGGYCFETNELLRHVLLTLGFEVKTFLAKVMWLKDRKTPPYHQILTVRLGNQTYLVEPGFGMPGPIEPLLLTEQDHLFTQTQTLDKHDTKQFRFILDEDGEYQLQSVVQTPWHPESEFKPLYAFKTEKVANTDEIAQSNWMVCVSEQSPFLSRLFITQPISLEEGKTGRKTLTQDFFKVSTLSGVKEQAVLSQAHFFELLQQEFGITLPPGSKMTARQVTFKAPALLEKLSALLDTAQPVIEPAPLPHVVLAPGFEAQSIVPQSTMHPQPTLTQQQSPTRPFL